MRNIACFIAGMAAMAAISTGVAEARRHYHHGHSCRLGQILVRHTGQCISRASAMRGGIIEPAQPARRGRGRRQLTQYATIEESIPPEPPRRPVDKPEVKCPQDEELSSVGWPGSWVYNLGFPQYRDWRKR